MTTTSPDLFQTVPRDRLSLFEDKILNYEGVKEFLEFRNEDVSKAAGVALSSVRYDDKIPAQLHERMREWANILNLVVEHFQGDAQKTVLWFTMPNPLLGNVSPRDMIRFGRYKKLLKFILNAAAESRR